MSEESLPHLEIRLLGQFRVLQNGIEVTGFRSAKARELLTLLVLAKGNAVDYKLAQELWGEDRPVGTEWQKHTQEGTRVSQDIVLNNLRVCLNRLQISRSKKVERTEMRLDPRRLRRIHRSSIALDLINADIDVLHIEAAHRSGGLQEMQEAIRLYIGDLLPESKVDRIVHSRDAIRKQYCELLARLTLKAKASGNFNEAVRYQRLRVASEPRNEELIEQLMDLLTHCGEENAARDVYDVYERNMLPNGKPGHALQMKRSTLQPAAIKPPSHWMPAPFARIPDELPELIGRDRELLEVQALLDRDRFVTLAGAPGVGKSLFAYHLASRLSIAFNHRVVWVELTESRTLGDMERRLLTCLGTPPDPSLSSVEAVKQAVGKERLLLLLDNCEQVVAHTGLFLMDLLQSIPKLKVVATTHIAWGSIPGEHVFHVKPLIVPPPRLLRLSPDQLVQELPRFAAVNLYLAAAANIQPAFQLTPQNTHSIARLVSLLEGMPLSITLAVGTSLPPAPEQALELLEKQGFASLTDRRNTLPPKHQSVNAAISIAYDLLPRRLQTLFVSLAVFHGGWTREAAEAVCEDASVAEALAQLQERSLLTVSLQDGVMRFSMLNIIHRFVSDLLKKSEEYETVSKRHVEYYRRLAVEAEPYLTGPESAIWLRRLRLEADNFASALTWCLASQHIELGLQLANAYWRIWLANSDYETAFHNFCLLLDAAPPEMDRSIRLKALHIAGIFALRRADYVHARHYLQLTIELAELLNLPHAKANASANLGNLESLAGNYAEAERIQYEALALCAKLPDQHSVAVRRSIAASLGHLACNATRAQDPRKSIEFGNQALAAFRSLEDYGNVAVALENLAEAYNQDGRGFDALCALSEALDISSGLGNWQIVAECHALLLMLAVARRAWYTAANLIGMHRTLHLGRELPLTAPDQPHFHDLREQTERALGPKAYQEAIRNASQLEPEQCVISMQSVCTNMKDILMSEMITAP